MITPLASPRMPGTRVTLLFSKYGSHWATRTVLLSRPSMTTSWYLQNVFHKAEPSSFVQLPAPSSASKRLPSKHILDFERK